MLSIADHVIILMICFFSIEMFLIICLRLFQQNGSAASLELDLEQYVVPAPTTSSGVVYAANLTESPRSLFHTGISSKNGITSNSLHSSTKAALSSADCSNIRKVLPQHFVCLLCLCSELGYGTIQ